MTDADYLENGILELATQHSCSGFLTYKFFPLSCLPASSIFKPMADGRWPAATWAGGKSEHQTAACRVEHADTAFPRMRRWKVSQKIYRQPAAMPAGKVEKAR